MVLDGPSSFEPQPEQRPYVTLIAKRKALNEQVSKILTNGAQHLQSLQSENRTTSSSSSGRNVEDFHFELLRLRQNWRLKKVSNTILGDLSYRTAGSQYKQSGVFEVVKAVDIGNKKESSNSSSINNEQGINTQPSGMNPSISNEDPATVNKGPKSVLRVNVPSELEGIAFIQVVIQKESEQLVSTNLTQNMEAFGGAISDDVHWQQKLEAAQNVLFCKELFSQLAREAIQLQAPIPHMVVGNQITACLFPDIQLLITLCHSTKPETKATASLTKKNSTSSINSDTPSTPSQYNQQRVHSHVLDNT